MGKQEIIGPSLTSSTVFWYNLWMDRYQVSKNILYNFLGQGILLLLGFFTTPFIIYKLGKDSYGIFILITSVVSYFSILDFGLGTAMIRSIADSWIRKDKNNLKKTIGTSLFTFTILGLLGTFLIIFAASPIINNLLHIPGGLLLPARIAFYIGAFSFFINMIGTVFIGILSALQRMDILNSRNIFLGILNAFGTIVLLFLGYGLIYIVFWNVFISALATLAFFIIIKRILPNTPLTIYFDKEIFLKLFKFGGFKFISNISGQIIFQLDRFLIGIFQPIASLAFYNPPLSLVQKSFTSLLNISSATFPAISQSSALGDTKRVKELYFRMSRLIAFVMFPILLIFFIGAYQIMNLWLGREIAEQGAPVLRIFAIAYLFITASAAPVVVSEGMNKPNIPAFFASFGALINLSSALILIPKYGIYGAAWALLINCILQVPVFVWFVSKKVIEVSILELLKSAYLKPFLAALVSSLISIYFFNSKQSLVDFMIGSLIFCLSYAFLNILFKTFDVKDKLAVKHLLTKMSEAPLRVKI